MTNIEEIDYDVCNHVLNDDPQATLEEMQASLCGAEATKGFTVMESLPDLPLCDEHYTLYADWTWEDSMAVVDKAWNEGEIGATA